MMMGVMKETRRIATMKVMNELSEGERKFIFSQMFIFRV